MQSSRAPTACPSAEQMPGHRILGDTRIKTVSYWSTVAFYWRAYEEWILFSINKPRLDFSYQTVAVNYQSIFPIDLLVFHHPRFFTQKSTLLNGWLISWFWWHLFPGIPEHRVWITSFQMWSIWSGSEQGCPNLVMKNHCPAELSSDLPQQTLYDSGPPGARPEIPGLEIERWNLHKFLSHFLCCVGGHYEDLFHFLSKHITRVTNVLSRLWGTL